MKKKTEIEKVEAALGFKLNTEFHPTIRYYDYNDTLEVYLADRSCTEQVINDQITLFWSHDDVKQLVEIHIRGVKKLVED